MPVSPVTVLPPPQPNPIGQGIQQGVQNFFQAQQIKQKQQQIDNERARAEQEGINKFILSAAQLDREGASPALRRLAYKGAGLRDEEIEASISASRNADIETKAALDEINNHIANKEFEIISPAMIVSLLSGLSPNGRKTVNARIDRFHSNLKNIGKLMDDKEKRDRLAGVREKEPEAIAETTALADVSKARLPGQTAALTEAQTVEAQQAAFLSERTAGARIAGVEAGTGLKKQKLLKEKQSALIQEENDLNDRVQKFRTGTRKSRAGIKPADIDAAEGKVGIIRGLRKGNKIAINQAIKDFLAIHPIETEEGRAFEKWVNDLADREEDLWNITFGAN